MWGSLLIKQSTLGNCWLTLMTWVFCLVDGLTKAYDVCWCICSKQAICLHLDGGVSAVTQTIWVIWWCRSLSVWTVALHTFSHTFTLSTWLFFWLAVSSVTKQGTCIYICIYLNKECPCHVFSQWKDAVAVGFVCIYIKYIESVVFFLFFLAQMHW